MHLYNNCTAGYGYIREEIIRYFDSTDGTATDPDGVAYDPDLEPGEWMHSEAVTEYSDYLIKLEAQDAFSLENPGHRYIDDFIALIKQIEQANGAPSSGYKIEYISVIMLPAGYYLIKLKAHTGETYHLSFVKL